MILGNVILSTFAVGGLVYVALSEWKRLRARHEREKLLENLARSPKEAWVPMVDEYERWHRPTGENPSTEILASIEIFRKAGIMSRAADANVDHAIALIRIKGQIYAVELQYEQESDRWLAEIPKLPGVMAYGAPILTAHDAIAQVAILADKVVSEKEG